MPRTVTALFDGEALHPQEAVDLERGRWYRIVIEEQVVEPPATHEPGILDDLLDLAVDTGIEDLAEQHDHYLYGTPKR